MDIYNAIIFLCAFIVLAGLLAFGNCLYQMDKVKKETQRRIKERLAQDGAD